jgi:hypothetical protein
MEEHKKNKGVKKYICQQNITHEKYKNCLFDSIDQYEKQNGIRCFNHTLYSLTQKKKVLSNQDDKCWINNDMIHTLTHGHYKIK